MKAIVALSLFVLSAVAGEQRYPAHPNVIDVTKPPYSAKGDGVTDDTDALQAAINEHVGRHHVLWFPKGTYLISRTITWPKRFSGRDNWGKTMLRGERRDVCVIRLKDGVFADAKKPQAIMWCGGFGSADWFHNHIENLTFDVGRNNPGATALQFYSNNTGALRECRFVAADDSGAIGIDLGHRDMNGPLLVKDCEVEGFRIGVSCAYGVNSQCFENITLRGQRETGFRNAGQHISIRGFAFDGGVPAVSTYGKLLLLDARIAGTADAAKHPAIVNYNGGRVFLREVKTTGYKRALADLETPDFAKAYRLTGEDKPGSLGPDIAEYSSHAVTTAFPSPANSLRLPVKPTPSPEWEDVSKWAIADNPEPENKNLDNADSIQRALNSGASTIFLPAVHYRTSRTLVVPANVRRIIGISGYVNYGHHDRPDFRIETGAEPLFIENFAGLHGGIEFASRRTVVLRSLGVHTLHQRAASEGAELFFEDVVGDDFRFRRQNLWARQLNIENQGTHLTNEASNVWVLGYKTERGGTLAHTLGGGRTEILGGFSYTTTAGKLAPMFVNESSSVFAFFGEVCYTKDPFAVLVRETRGGETREVKADDGKTAPYSGRAP